MSDADAICKRGIASVQGDQQICSTPNGELSEARAAGRVRVRWLSLVREMMVMVMAAPTPPQRASHLAPLATAVARTSPINGADQSSRSKIKAERKGLRERAGVTIYQEPQEVMRIFC